MTAGSPPGGSKLTLPAFGVMESARVLALDDLFAVVSDKFPVSPGHTLIIPRRPAQRFRELTLSEKARLLIWVEWAQQHLEETLSPVPDGFNLGINDGPAAGQTILQFHFHLIPRGGIRWVKPGQARCWL